jgi:hypothetical protein
MKKEKNENMWKNKPMLLYGHETWTVTRQMKSTLKTWERRMLRKIYGPIKYQNGWGIRSNGELQVCVENQIL